VLERREAGGFLRRLDPRTKTLLVLLCTLLVVIVDHPLVAPGLSLCFLGLWLAAGMSFAKIRAYLKLLAALIVFVIVLQTLFTPGERYLLRPLIPEAVPLIGGRGSLKWEGLILGLVIGCRLLALTLLLPMLTMTTETRLLALGFCKLGLPYKAAFVATTALNLIPAFEEDARIIMDAQKLRGLRAFEEGSLADKFRAYPALAIPLIICALRRARMLGTAMDARAFGAFKTRTWLEHISFSRLDFCAFAAGLVFGVTALALNFTL
jgi:energy-coupling factor transport system permease protein